jgi:hypothetical protein
VAVLSVQVTSVAAPATNTVTTPLPTVLLAVFACTYKFEIVPARGIGGPAHEVVELQLIEAN